MAIPIPTLEQATRTLWKYRQNLCSALAEEDMTAAVEAIDDIRLVSELSDYDSLRRMATSYLADDKLTVGAIGAALIAAPTTASAGEAVTA